MNMYKTDMAAIHEFTRRKVGRSYSGKFKFLVFFTENGYSQPVERNIVLHSNIYILGVFTEKLYNK